jgi:hypothetical protein
MNNSFSGMVHSWTLSFSYLEAAEFLRSQKVTGHAATRQGHVLHAFQWAGRQARTHKTRVRQYSGNDTLTAAASRQKHPMVASTLPPLYSSKIESLVKHQANKTYAKMIGSGGVDRINLAREGSQWWTLVNTVMSLRVPPTEQTSWVAEESDYGEWRYSSMPSWVRHWMDLRGHVHTPPALFHGKGLPVCALRRRGNVSCCHRELNSESSP